MTAPPGRHPASRHARDSVHPCRLDPAPPCLPDHAATGAEMADTQVLRPVTGALSSHSLG